MIRDEGQRFSAVGRWGKQTAALCPDHGNQHINHGHQQRAEQACANRILRRLPRITDPQRTDHIDDDDAKKAGEYLQSTIESNLKGVNVRVNSLPKKTALVRGQNGNFDALLMGWQADFTDPISFLDLNTSNASYNWGKWANKEYDKYVAASKTTGNENTRFEDLAKAERVLLTEQGVVPLYQPAEAWMVRPTVKGVVYNGAGANYNFKYAYVEK